MSTKLYNGLRLTAHAPDIYALTKIVSKRMREVFHALALSYIAGFVTQLVDDPDVRAKAIDEDAEHTTVQTAAEKLWLAQQQSINPRLRGHDPLRFQIVFGEVDDENGTRRLAYVFADRHEYMTALLGLRSELGRPFFADYHYQNQTDEPEEISAAEWDQRRKDWDQVLRSDDPETNDTFAHLPGWELPDTIRGVFGVWLWWLEEVDLDSRIDARARLHDVIQRAAWRQLDHSDLTGDLDSADDKQVDLGELSRQVTRLHRSVRRVLADREDEDQPVSGPPALPTDLQTKVTALPPVFEPEQKLIDAVLAQYRQLES